MQKNKGDESRIKKTASEKQLGQVVILCGGRGVRLRPTTDLVPKVLVKLHGRPILEYIINFYKSRGFSRFILCVGYKGDKVREHYKVVPEGISIDFSDAGEKASMLERIGLLKDQVEESFFVSYGDTLMDLDVNAMYDFHKIKQAIATIVSAKIRNPFGLVSYDDQGWVTSFVEKPLMDYYIGSFLIERSALLDINKDMLDKPDGDGLVDFFLSLMSDKRLAVFEHKGAKITFNTEQERQEAEENLVHFYTFSEEGK